MHRHLIIVAILVTIAEGTVRLKPPELLLAEEHRARINTATVELQIMPDPSYNEFCYFTERLAGMEVLYIIRGLEDGRFAPNCEIGQPYAFSELRLLMKEGEQWDYHEFGPSAHVRNEKARYIPYYDIRKLGFEPAPVTAEVEDIWFRKPALTYEVYYNEPHIEVVGYWPDDRVVRWLLDPLKDMQPTRVTALVEGDEISVCENVYESIGDIWFPRNSTYTYKDQVVTKINVLHAEFNQSHHPQTFTPADLGIVAGVEIMRQGERTKLRWSGDAIISNDDWLRGVKEGTLNDSGYNALMDGLRSSSGGGRYPRLMDNDFLGLTSTVTRKPGLWEDYTRRFIQRFRLEGEQIDRAWTHLKECQKPAYAYLDEQKSVIREAETERAKVAAELAKVEAELAKVEAELAKGDTDRATPGANLSPSAGAKEKSTSGAKEKSSSGEKEKSSAGAGTKDETSAGGSPQERSAAQAPDPASADAADDAVVKQRAAVQEQLGKLQH